MIDNFAFQANSWLEFKSEDFYHRSSSIAFQLFLIFSFFFFGIIELFFSRLIFTMENWPTKGDTYRRGSRAKGVWQRQSDWWLNSCERNVRVCMRVLKRAAPYPYFLTKIFRGKISFYLTSNRRKTCFFSSFSSLEEKEEQAGYFNILKGGGSLRRKHGSTATDGIHIYRRGTSFDRSSDRSWKVLRFANKLANFHQVPTKFTCVVRSQPHVPLFPRWSHF